jgi:Concanavalin A-like lectin/glucanases superfamily
VEAEITYYGGAVRSSVDFQPGQDLPFRYTRKNWLQAGVDQFVQAPSENPDSFEALTNVLSPLTNGFRRRYGYRAFVPKLDQGNGTGDQVTTSILFGTGFDGSLGLVYTNNSMTWTPSGTNSVEFWFLTYSVAGGFFVSLQPNQMPTAAELTYFGVYMNTAGTIGVGAYNGTTGVVACTSPLAYNDGKPHHCVVTETNGTYILYVDGAQVATGTSAAWAGSHTAYWRFAQGSDSTGFPAISQYLGTFLSHVSVWNVVLTPTQVTNHYNALIGATGSQSNYEAITKADSPTHFWFLTEATNANAPTQIPTVQSLTQLIQTGQTVQFGNNTTLNNTLLVIIAEGINGQTGVTPTISDNQGNAYTLIKNTTKLYSYYAPVTNPGSTTITITAVGTSQLLVIAQELGGILSGSSPVDGANASLISSPTSTVTTPTINTSTSPDRVFSVVFTFVGASNSDPTATVKSGQGFTSSATITTPLTIGGNAGLALAYRSASAPGPYSATWTSTNAADWQTETFGLTQATVVLNTGTTAFDQVQTDNGTYFTEPPVPNNTHSGFTGTPPLTTFTVAISPSTQGINAGDTSILALTVNPNPSATVNVSTITDSNGNVWSALTPAISFTNTGAKPQLVQIWYMGNTVPVSTAQTLTITVTLNNSSTPVNVFFMNMNDLSTIDQSNHATGTSTAPSSGGINISTGLTEFILAFVGSASTATSISAPFTVSLNGSANNAGAIAYADQMGSVVDTWTTSGSASWAAEIVSFVVNNAYQLGESVVVP